MSGWLSSLQRQYGIVIYRYVKTLRGIWLETNRGAMVFQSLPVAFLPKAEFVYKVNLKLQRTSLMFPILKNSEGEIVTQIGEQAYFMIGSPISSSSWVDYGKLGSRLAEFHSISVECLEGVTDSFSEIGRWPRAWQSKYEQLERFESVAQARIGTEEQDPFDAFFVNNAAYFRQLTELSLMRLETCDYEAICDDTFPFGRLSFTNFSYETITLNQFGQPFFTDPFSLVEDTRVRDLAQFIKADVRLYGWDPSRIYTFLAAYHAVSPITPNEFQLMYALILLPGRLLKKVETLYYRPSLFRSETTHLELYRGETETMTAEVAYTEMRRAELLIQDFPLFARRYFGVSLPPLVEIGELS
ncbi:hypothetical protein BEP19_13910 [Ammoniphilus oxalaticus]|uniref:Spore coat protein YutH n=1 Tax=Ammoniphilus oxalaticus TaxID=66863 RepID=A0A419SEK8_9BACL|nr:hypothetical protein [Ammoniphilus oxalaticus]RKD21721.1 hypothetical protein BEP19_13910 [Ammoniphilus oxalaticus]